MGELIHLITEPISETSAQVGTLCVLVLTGLDVMAGCLSAHLHDEFSSYKLRDGLIRKMQNILLMCGALFADVALLGGLQLPFSPCYLALCTAFIVMEIKSLLEIWAQDHPDVPDAIDDVFGGLKNDDD